MVSVPKVFNKHHGDAPSDAVYIGRGSPYGNPFVIGKDGNRAEVIAKYRVYLEADENLLNKVKTELKGKNLLCFCKPAGCHGDIILLTANPELNVSSGTLF